MKDKKLKYILIILMTLSMGLVLISCGSKGDDSTTTNSVEEEQTPEEAAESTVSTVEGTGYVDLEDIDAGSFRADLALEVDTAALSESHLSFSGGTGILLWENSSITSVTESESGDVIIKGSGTAQYNDEGTTVEEDCTFTLTLTDTDIDGNPESVSAELISSVDGETLFSFTPEPLVNSTIIITY